MNQGAFNDIFNNFYRQEYEALLSQHNTLQMRYEAVQRQCHSYSRRNHALNITNQNLNRHVTMMQDYVNDIHLFMCASVARDPSLDRPYTRFLRANNAIDMMQPDFDPEAIEMMDAFFDDAESIPDDETDRESVNSEDMLEGIDWNEIRDLTS